MGLDDLVERALHVEHHRVEAAAVGLVDSRDPRGVLSRSVSPIDCASRRAGSIVSTTALRPCSAARSASAADVVVLPTPPEPQHTMM